MKLTAINIYPVKSLGGITLDEAILEPQGLQFDRRWMLADPTGRFQTQRELPQLTQFGTAIRPNFLEIFEKRDPAQRVEVPLFPDENRLEKQQTVVWDSKIEARVLPDEINRWFSERLDTDLRLLWMSPSTRRRTDPLFAPGRFVSFADGYPILITGEASLADLNSRLESPVPMNRFRPNLVFTGGEPYFEEKLEEFCIGGERFRGVKTCGRCIVITTDQETGERSQEPLRTLAGYQKRGNRVIFGQNVVWLGWEKGAKIVVGDEITF